MRKISPLLIASTAALKSCAAVSRMRDLVSGRLEGAHQRMEDGPLVIDDQEPLDLDVRHSLSIRPRRQERFLPP